MHDFWGQVFGNNRPVEVEVGAGTGTFVLPAAAANPQINFLAIENSGSRAARLEFEVNARQLKNVVVLHADAACVLGNVVPDASVSAYHIYFPDPWWKRRHHRRRLFTQSFAASLARTLATGCPLHVATDVADVFERIAATIAAQTQFVHQPTRRSPRTQQTSFEKKGLRRGAIIHEAVYIRVAADSLD
ncbi:MAG TPA: hypothetical protein VMT89_13175 [Candidatus Acidoferrales bacterium]|nr:hypothetical protein [Candidatus Acidoferrales bacterium]